VGHGSLPYFPEYEAVGASRTIQKSVSGEFLDTTLCDDLPYDISLLLNLRALCSVPSISALSIDASSTPLLYCFVPATTSILLDISRHHVYRYLDCSCFLETLPPVLLVFLIFAPYLYVSHRYGSLPGKRYGSLTN